MPVPGVIQLNSRRVRYEMDLRGWRNEDLAAATGCHPQTIAYFFKHERMRRDTALKIAEAFRAHPEVPGMAELLPPYEEAVG